MKPSIIRAGICSAVTAAVTVTLSGLVPVTATAGPALPEMANKLAGKIVFLDPGHQGPGHGENLAKQVSDGRGGTKPCQTTGMTTVHGVPEHTINWNVAQLVKTSLEGLGAQVVLSRQDDQGWGGCIDDRARAANESGAAVAVSIHADSAPADQRGFHLIVPELPIPDPTINAIQSTAGLAASTAMRDAYLGAGFVPAKYASPDGLQPRKDIAGPALTTVPDVFLEMGNGANAEDAALLESQEGQLRHAIAITTGLVGYLLGPQSVTPEMASDRPAAAPVPQPQPATEPSAGAPAPQPAAVEPLVGVPAPHPASTGPLALEPAQQPAPTDPLVGVPAPQPAATEPPVGAPAQLPASTQPPGGAPAPTAPQAQTAPQVQAAPNSPQTQTAPGVAPRPGTQQSPYTQQTPNTPGTQQSPSTTETGDMAALRETVDMVLTLLVPLARALGLDNNMVTAELINLAYTLAAKFLSPAK
ncbi:N-acetylmuramoyl-L-alanine amidase [Nocardia brasiliensis]|uniref:N-acetylmuramoyl-L-alanine amidase n=1 Tax=Nocardia brasiliensis TaxID=37326 RepID=UPI00366ADF06